MQNTFEFRNPLVEKYQNFSRSFTTINAVDIKAKVDEEYANGRYWPEPLIQINPHYKRSKSV
ncbi:MAG: hypothetical protein LBK60_04215 [Verrucomicrobiales bacterium]|jgi:hypothetical protein|nr:hypothetical protein [Verrucomicrobiales bacterium]